MLAKERKEIYNKTFETDEGQKVLDDLCNQHYISRTTYNKDNSEYETAYREGQRAVVLRIQKILNKKETK